MAHLEEALYRIKELAREKEYLVDLVKELDGFIEESGGFQGAASELIDKLDDFWDKYGDYNE